MITTLKVRLEPNNKQKSKLFQSAGVARWAYNWTLERQEENYQNGGKFIKDGDLRKELTLLKQTEELKWLNNSTRLKRSGNLKRNCAGYSARYQTNMTRTKKGGVTLKPVTL